jgi:hypothetical protein
MIMITTISSRTYSEWAVALKYLALKLFHTPPTLLGEVPREK